MVLKLYSAPEARAGHGVVALVLAEKQIPFELVLIDQSAKQHKTPEYLGKQPWGQVPYIDDDGFVLYESRAIARYLAEKYADQGTPLLPPPSDLQKKALFEQAASIEFANFHPLAFKLILEKVVKMMNGQPVDEVAVAGYIAELSSNLKIYDEILGKQKYVAGDELTLADLFHLSYAPSLAPFGIDVMTTAGLNVTRWWNDLLSRSAWVELQAQGIRGTSP
ncbi:glutathione S-transferase [Roridomyces roridus]|uniref:glutathione transferase n=1 Tax=Roridomyces roridus TaxID=1738132 RepID=A0AAD7C763_9AGAR|nr:glutathione S-transferase [Roridomyces roridus]